MLLQFAFRAPGPSFTSPRHSVSQVHIEQERAATHRSTDPGIAAIDVPSTRSEDNSSDLLPTTADSSSVLYYLSIRNISNKAAKFVHN